MLEGRSGMLEGRCERPRASPLHACPTGPASLPRDTAGLLALARSQRPYGHPAFVPTERAMGEARRNAGGAPWPWNAGGALWECRRGAVMLEARRNAGGALWNAGGALRAAASKPAPRLPHRSGVPPARHGRLARARALAAPLRSSGVRSDREGDGRGAPQCRRRALALECRRGALECWRGALGMPERRRNAGGALWNAGGALRAAASKPAPRLPHRSGVPPTRHGGLARARALAAPLRSSGVVDLDGQTSILMRAGER